MKNACEGVMYPQNAAALVKKALEEGLKEECGKAKCTIVPHKAWSICRDELDSIFKALCNRCAGEEPPKRIFVLAPLHKGRILGEPFTVYTPCKGTLEGTDWSIRLETPMELLNERNVKESDDVCTEEHSLEVIAPYLAVLYPNTPVAYLLAPKPTQGDDAKLDEIKRTIGRMACDGIIFVSDDKDTNCASMWY